MKKTDFKSTSQCIEFFDRSSLELIAVHPQKNPNNYSSVLPLESSKGIGQQNAHTYSSSRLEGIFPASQNIWNSKTKYDNRTGGLEDSLNRSISGMARPRHTVYHSKSKSGHISGPILGEERENQEKRRKDHLYSDINGERHENERSNNRYRLYNERMKYMSNNNLSKIENKLTRDSSVIFRQSVPKEEVHRKFNRSKTGPKVCLTDEDVQHNIDHLRRSKEQAKIDFTKLNRNRTVGRYEPKPINMNIQRKKEPHSASSAKYKMGSQSSVRFTKLNTDSLCEEEERKPIVKAQPKPVMRNSDENIFIDAWKKNVTVNTNQTESKIQSKLSITPVSVTTNYSAHDEIEFVPSIVKTLNPKQRETSFSKMDSKDNRKSFETKNNRKPMRSKESHCIESTKEVVTPLDNSKVVSLAQAGTPRIKYIEFRPVREDLKQNKKVNSNANREKRKQPTKQIRFTKTQHKEKDVKHQQAENKKSPSPKREMNMSSPPRERSVFRVLLNRIPRPTGHPALALHDYSKGYRSNYSASPSK